MSKSERIRELLATTDKTRAEIAEEVGRLQEYVRVVEQRLLKADGTTPDRRWKQRHRERDRASQADYQRRRYHRDPEFRAKALESGRRYYANNREARLAYAHDRRRGKKLEAQANG